MTTILHKALLNVNCLLSSEQSSVVDVNHDLVCSQSHALFLCHCIFGDFHFTQSLRSKDDLYFFCLNCRR